MIRLSFPAQESIPESFLHLVAQTVAEARSSECYLPDQFYGLLAERWSEAIDNDAGYERYVDAAWLLLRREVPWLTPVESWEEVRDYTTRLVERRPGIVSPGDSLPCREWIAKCRYEQGQWQADEVTPDGFTDGKAGSEGGMADEQVAMIAASQRNQSSTEYQWSSRLFFVAHFLVAAFVFIEVINLESPMQQTRIKAAAESGRPVDLANYADGGKYLVLVPGIGELVMIINGPFWLTVCGVFILATGARAVQTRP